jgi:ribosomal RNA-processing protein 8
LKKKRNKIICVTYQSYGTLLDNLGETKINICIYDEAHHAVGETYQKLIFENEVCEKQVFFTATPKNANGIIMYDREQPEAGVCGKLVYDYTYLDGVNEDYLNSFEIRVDMFTENTNSSLYESICRAILASENNRVLTFHSDVNADRDKSVKHFVDEPKFKECFNKILSDEFPEKLNYYNKITMKGLMSEIKPSDRKLILNEFDITPNNEIFVISSCETIGEGIDTKNANMCVFIDPKSSFVKIIQNIGRIVRKEFNVDKPKSTILIPCWVDKNKYLECGGDREKCDEVIRQDMNKDGNFNGILNVLSALKQEDEDIYDICLHYPDSYSPQEIINNLEKQGYMIDDPVGEGSLIENLEYMIDCVIDYEEYQDCDSDEELIMRVSEDNNICIEIHTNSLENPVEIYNSECESGEIIRIYKSIDAESEEPVYQPIVKKCGKKKNKDTIIKPDIKKRFNYNVHTNADIKVLWNITNNFDITKDICSCILDCEIVDKWYETLEKVKNFMDDNKKRPNCKSKNKDEKTLGGWLHTQRTNYKNKNNSMKTEEKRNLWEDFVEKYKEHFINNDDKWNTKFEELKQFIDENKKKPSYHSTNKEEKTLGEWIGRQVTNYKKKKESMKTEEKRKIWEEFLKEYKEYFIDNDEVWNTKFEEVKKFIDDNKKKPSVYSKNKEEKVLGKWIQHQLTNYKNHNKSMKTDERRKIWEEFLEEYKEYFIDNDEVWNTNFEKVKQFMDEYKKRPSDKSKNKDEKVLGQWNANQLRNYKNQNNSMETEERQQIWKEFVEKYKEYFIDNDEVWNTKFEEVKKFMNKENKRPSSKTKNTEETILGCWIRNQLINYKKKQQTMKTEERRKLWDEFLEEYKEYFIDYNEVWNTKFEELKKFMDEYKKRPNKRSNNEDEKVLGEWIGRQVTNYKKKNNSMKTEERRQIWDEFKYQYSSIFNDEEDSVEIQIKEEPIKKKVMNLPKSSKKREETREERKTRIKTEISQLHQRYKTMNSQNLNNEFKENPDLWKKYHEISEKNEESFPTEGIPRNRIIQELTKIKTKRTKQVVDMGCGKGQISHHFKNDGRFNFMNYDHISENDRVISCDISNLPLEEDSVDICILSLAMWGSNCRNYITEASRILESNGQLYIIEPTKRWSEKDELGNIIQGNEASKMTELLRENGFKIIHSSIEKFCLFTCVKM